MRNIVKLLLTTAIFNASEVIAADDPYPQQLVPHTGNPGQFEISLNIGADNLKDALTTRYPSLFAGRKECAPASLLQSQKIALGDNLVNISIMSPEASPHFDRMRSEIIKMTSKHPQLQVLVDEIDYDTSTKQFDIINLYGYGFRVLGAISTEATPDALSLFKTYDGENTDSFLRKNWQSPFSLLAAISDKIPSNMIPPIHYLSRLSNRLQDLITKESSKISRLLVHYPVFGRGKLGLATLIEEFINRRYPMPITDQPQTAHGMPMTPFFFGFHDYIHGEIDSLLKNSTYESATYYKLQKLAADVIEADQLIPPVVRFMAAKTQLIEETLSALLDLYFTYYLPEHSMADLKKPMVGFFRMVHEEFQILADVFDSSNFDDILDIFLGDITLSHLRGDVETRITSNKTQHTIVKTDPLTGKAMEVSHEILSNILASGISPTTDNFPPTPLPQLVDLQDKKYRIEINDSPMITTVTLKLPGGVEHQWKLLTLKYELSSSLDNIGLLKVAGIEITPPSIEELSSENGYQIALDYLEKVEGGLMLCRNAFKVSAHDLLGVKLVGRTKTLWKKFWDISRKLEKQLEAEVAKIKSTMD